MYAGAGMHFFLVFEKPEKREKHENIENVENLLDPACSSSQSQPAHLARNAPSRQKGRFSGLPKKMHQPPAYIPRLSQASQALPGPPKPSQTLTNPHKSPNPQEKHENVENLLDPGLLELPEPAGSLSQGRSKPSGLGGEGSFFWLQALKNQKKCTSPLHTFPGSAKPSQTLPNPRKLSNLQEKHENVENLLDRLLELPEPAYSLSRDAPSLPAWVEEGHLEGLGGCLEGWEGLGKVRRGLGGSLEKVFRVGICIALLCYCSSHIYIYGTPPCTHAFPDVCQEMRGSWG